MRALLLCLFGLTYATISVRRAPWLPVGRPAAALVGACALVLAGHIAPPYGLSGQEALAAVEPNTLALLFGMMLVSSALGEAGFFERASTFVAARVRTPVGLLYAVTLGAGVLSALLVNDAVCLLATPLVVRLARRSGVALRPLLLGLAMGANAGSAMTLSGNPQNMLVARLSGITFRGYLRHAGLATLVALGVTAAVIHVMHRAALSAAVAPEPRASHVPSAQGDSRLLTLSLVALGAVVLADLAGVSLAWSALGGGALVLVAAGDRAERLFARVEWGVLVFFSGLFIAVAALRKTGLPAELLGHLGNTSGRGATALLVAVLSLGSQVVSNVPLILLLETWLRRFGDQDGVWTLTAMVSTLAGNLTLLGSVANVIVMEQSREKIGFWEYFRVGLPVTALSTAAALGVYALTR